MSFPNTLGLEQAFTPGRFYSINETIVSPAGKRFLVAVACSPDKTLTATASFAALVAAGKFVSIDSTLLSITEPLYVSPLAAAVVTISPSAGASVKQIVTPAGTIATLTITLGNGTTAGQVVDIVFSQIVTTLTVTTTNVSSTLGLAAATSASVGQNLQYVWSVANLIWVRTR